MDKKQKKVIDLDDLKEFIKQKGIISIPEKVVEKMFYEAGNYGRIDKDRDIYKPLSYTELYNATRIHLRYDKKLQRSIPVEKPYRKY